jgi:hypothetical protein
MKPQPYRVALALVLGLALSACQSPREPPYPPIPPLRAETMAKPPVTATPLFWQPGHWDWNGTGYVWAPGVFVAQDGHSNIFQYGTWAKAPDGTWFWEPARWQ